MTVVVLNGPLNSGKTTVGRALAARIGAAFIDGDDLAGHRALPLEERWAVALDRIVDAVARSQGSGMVIAYPIDQAGYDRIAAACPGRLVVATLAPDLAAALTERGGRRLTAWERARIPGMYDEGYHRRSFSDLFVDTGRLTVPACVDRLVQAL